MSREVPHIAVVGAGVFGATAALELRNAGYAVTLFESRQSIFEGASARNLFRLHRGFHYPRDHATAAQASEGFQSFVARYPESVRYLGPHYYAIARQDSLTSSDEFLLHCENIGLSALPVPVPRFLSRQVGTCFQVFEPYFDPERLKAAVQAQIQESGVELVVGSRIPPDEIRRGHDVVVVAAYSATNAVLVESGCEPVLLQYELCEVPVLQTPNLNRCSTVVLDGSFVSIAPYGDNRHLLYDVDESVLCRRIAERQPEFANFVGHLGGATLTHSAPSTQWKSIRQAASRFIGRLEDAGYLGSQFAVRVVPPGSEATDCRQTEVRWAAHDVLVVLSGKISVCVDAAERVAAEVSTRTGFSRFG